MPFKSKAQQRFLFSRKPKGVDLKEWSDKTDFKSLPEKKAMTLMPADFKPLPAVHPGMDPAALHAALKGHLGVVAPPASRHPTAAAIQPMAPGQSWSGYVPLK